MDRQSWQRWLLLLFSGLFGALLIGESLLSSGRWIGHAFPGFRSRNEQLTLFVAGWSESWRTWSPGSSLLSADPCGRADFTSARSAAHPLLYQIVRDG
jgi:hypothetical protein